MKPLISIIVPVYNTEAYLDRCLESIVYQTYTNIEIICIDDGSTDDSGIILEKWKTKDPRIKVFHKNNGGVASARNLGLKKSEGEYIGWVDSDDTITSDYFEHLISYAISYDAEIVVANSSAQTNRLIRNRDILKAFLLNQLSRGMPYNLISKKLFDNETFKNYSVGEDTDMLMHLFEKADIVCVISSNGYNRFVRNDSAVHGINPKNISDWLDVYASIGQYLSLKYIELKPYCSFRMIFEIGIVYSLIKKWPKNLKKSLIKRMKKLYVRSLFRLDAHIITLRRAKRIVTTGIRLLIG